MQVAKKADFKPFDAYTWRLGIVTARFNKEITNQLQQNVINRSKQYKIKESNIDIINVAGSVEIPLVLQQMAKSGKYNALIAIGCIVKGETAHFDYVCKFVSDGILRVQLDQNMPIGFGVLTCNTMAEAQSRSGLGSEHIDAVLHQAQSINNL